MWLRVERDGSADNGGISGKAIFPECVAEDYGARAGLHVRRGEGAAIKRTETEDWEKIFSDFAGFETLRLAVTGEFFGGILKDGDARERSGGGADIGEVE